MHILSNHKKYEARNRDKSNQLLKIANALTVSINLFMDFDIETVSDVLSLIFKMDEPVDVEFVGKKNKNGLIDPITISIKFKNPQINERLAKWAYTKALVQKTIDSKDEFESNAEYNAEVADMQEKTDNIKQSLADNNLVVKKGTEGIIIKQ